MRGGSRSGGPAGGDVMVSDGEGVHTSVVDFITNFMGNLGRSDFPPKVQNRQPGVFPRTRSRVLGMEQRTVYTGLTDAPNRLFYFYNTLRLIH